MSEDPNNYFFGYIGVASALVFANLGAAYGSAKAGVGICSMGVLKPELIMKSVVPVVMAGILGIYGMIVAVIIVQKSTSTFIILCCGFSSLAAGLAIGIVGDAGVRANAQQDKIFVGMILILIFGEALALYGLIVSLILTSQG
ncbi:UNVERIFIED_CONTAM: hypothetical protein GTU68_021096 [Idotea baltica]|nr:hypothetical protein [Idotea baltica]